MITYPSSLGTPGGGTIGCIQIARHLKRLGVEVIVVPVARGQADSASILACDEVVAPANPLHYLLDGVPVARVVRHILARRPVIAVLGWSHEAAFLPRLLQPTSTIFGMIAAHPSYTLWRSRQTSHRWIKSIADHWFRWRPLRNADIVFSLSEYTRHELIQLFGLEHRRVVTTHWAADSSFLEVPRVFRGPITRLIFFGSLAPLKGVFDAVQVLGRLTCAGYENLVLKIAGWGDQEAVWRVARDTGVENRVTFLGRLDHQDLARELAWAQLAILPSHAESFGLAICEAQAAGLPVISYRTGAVPEVVVNGETGWLVPVGEIPQLVEAIKEVLSDPYRAFEMGLKGRERVARLFSWHETARTMLRAIEVSGAGVCRCC